jgi:hypothetical protein
LLFNQEAQYSEFHTTEDQSGEDQSGEDQSEKINLRTVYHPNFPDWQFIKNRRQ